MASSNSSHGYLLTLSITMLLLVESKLAWIVLHHVFPEQALDDLFDCGGAADMELLYSFAGQIEGCAFVGNIGCRRAVLRVPRAGPVLC